MQDPRFDKLAAQLVNYSLKVAAGEKVLIDISDTPEAMVVALVKALRKAGAAAFYRHSLPAVERELLLEPNESQLECSSALLLEEMRQMQCYLAIRGSSNISNMSDISAPNMALAMKYKRGVIDYRVNNTRWCVLRWPTPSMAQQAQMSTAAFEDFYFDVCTLDYAALLPAHNVLKDLMNATDKVHIVGPGTDLRFSIKDIPAVVCAGEYNIPDGEVFCAPVRDSVEGIISYNCPSIYQGISFDDVVFEFSKGKIVKATAGAKTAQLNAILDTDEGARYIGEFALGTNPRILHPMRDILFDEKIAGSFHFTPGQSYANASNGNNSQVHWDLVNIQRSDYGGGEMYFDGVLVRKDGVFLHPQLCSLNPQP